MENRKRNHRDFFHYGRGAKYIPPEKVVCGYFKQSDWYEVNLED